MKYIVKGRTVEIVRELHNPGRSIHDPDAESGFRPTPLPGLTSYYIDGVEVSRDDVAQLFGIDGPTLDQINTLRGP